MKIYDETDHLPHGAPEPEKVRMEYRIVRDDSAHRLDTEVNKLISLGWQPIGGHNVVVQGTWTEYSQAMIKHG